MHNLYDTSQSSEYLALESGLSDNYFIPYELLLCGQSHRVMYIYDINVATLLATLIYHLVFGGKTL